MGLEVKKGECFGSWPPGFQNSTPKPGFWAKFGGPLFHGGVGGGQGRWGGFKTRVVFKRDF